MHHLNCEVNSFELLLIEVCVAKMLSYKGFILYYKCEENLRYQELGLLIIELKRVKVNIESYKVED